MSPLVQVERAQAVICRGQWRCIGASRTAEGPAPCPDSRGGGGSRGEPDPSGPIPGLPGHHSYPQPSFLHMPPRVFLKTLGTETLSLLAQNPPLVPHTTPLHSFFLPSPLPMHSGLCNAPLSRCPHAIPFSRTESQLPCLHASPSRKLSLTCRPSQAFLWDSPVPVVSLALTTRLSPHLDWELPESRAQDCLHHCCLQHSPALAGEQIATESMN